MGKRSDRTATGSARRILCAVQLITLAIGVVPLCGVVQAEIRVTHVQIAGGRVVTGGNRLLGEPLFSYDFAPNPTFGFNTLDEHNPGGELPTPLTPKSSRNAVLATTFPNLAEVPEGILPNVNIPLRDVGTYVNGFLDRGPVPFHLDLGAPIIGPTQAEPAKPDPIRLRDWLRGRGLAITRCGRYRNHASIFVRRLIPNRLYTAWSLWLGTDGAFNPIALGGAPSVIMTNAHGSGYLSRKINFCPEEAARKGIARDMNGDRDHLMAFIVILHSDSVAWGPIPTPAPAGYPPGSIVHGHMWFDFGAGVPVNNSH